MCEYDLILAQRLHGKICLESRHSLRIGSLQATRPAWEPTSWFGNQHFDSGSDSGGSGTNILIWEPTAALENQQRRLGTNLRC